MVTPTGTSDYSTVTSSNQLFTLLLSDGNLYLFITTTNCFVKQGVDNTVVASAAAGNHCVPAGGSLLLSGKQGAYLAVIRDSADGKATLTPVRTVVY